MQSSDCERLFAAIVNLCAPAVVIGGPIRSFLRGLMPEEASFVTNAVQKRREEFEAGRCAARMAMERLGVAHCAILRGTAGQPLWPEGITGSISHCDDLCLAVCSRKRDCPAPGIDIELLGKMERDLWRIVFTRDEIASLEKHPDPIWAAGVVFSAKEAFMKAQFSLSGQAMDMLSMQTRPLGDGRISLRHKQSGSFFASIPEECALRHVTENGHVAVFCALHPAC